MKGMKQLRCSYSGIVQTTCPAVSVLPPLICDVTPLLSWLMAVTSVPKDRSQCNSRIIDKRSHNSVADLMRTTYSSRACECVTAKAYHRKGPEKAVLAAPVLKFAV